MLLRRYGYTTIGFLSLAFACVDANAYCCVSPTSWLNGVYIGAFGGRAHTSHNHVRQTGVAFFPPVSGGPLVVNAHGHAKGATIGFGGLHIGYQLPGWRVGACSSLCLAPAVEAEAYFFTKTRHGDLSNPNDRLPEHDFLDSFPAHNQVYLLNAVFALKSSCSNLIYPYLGVGVGAMNVSIHHADSKQVAPPEPGVNHFNSHPNASRTVFAAQGKAGLSLCIMNNLRVFAEYRLLHANSSKYTFGSTKYPQHVPTTKFKVKFGSTNYNMWDLGIEYKF